MDKEQARQDLKAKIVAVADALAYKDYIKPISDYSDLRLKVFEVAKNTFYAKDSPHAPLRWLAVELGYMKNMCGQEAFKKDLRAVLDAKNAWLTQTKEQTKEQTMKITYDTVKEQTMKPFKAVKPFEAVKLVYGMRADECTDEDLMSAIRRVNREMDALKDLAGISTKVDAKIAELKVNRDALVKLLDGAPNADTSPV